MQDTKAYATMIRVNQAGEYGAMRIYAGQMAVLGELPALKAMADEEAEHLRQFNDLVVQYQVRPTIFQPLWSVAGFALGAVTALLGEKAAHACTLAVEDVIDNHYQEQLHTLMTDLSPQGEGLRHTIARCHADEVAHKNLAQQLGAESAPFFPYLTTAVRWATKIAISLSKRL